MKEKEYCENCKKEITDEMKNNQQVIYASAEHTLYAPNEDELIFVGYTDEMFSGVFCCQECYNEISGINIAHKKGREEMKKEVINLINEQLKVGQSLYTIMFLKELKEKVERQ